MKTGHLRLSSLDGLRGICAFLVMIYHYTDLRIAHGYLCVDMFFLLSGFVLALAYTEKFAQGMSISDFLLRRVIRLGPAIWFASLLSAIVTACSLLAAGSLTPMSTFLTTIGAIFNMLLIPILGWSGSPAFPANNVTWSLLAELIVNAAFAVYATRFTLRNLVWIVVCGWVVAGVVAFVFHKLDYGGHQVSVLFGPIRALPSFMTGVLLFKLWREDGLKFVPSIHPLWAYGFWLVLIAAITPVKGPVPDLFVAIAGAPLALAVLIRSAHETPGWIKFLGAISYPLYAFHVVVLMAVKPLGTLWGLQLGAVLSILAATAFAVWLEPKAQRLLTARFGGHMRGAPAKEEDQSPRTFPGRRTSAPPI